MKNIKILYFFTLALYLNPIQLFAVEGSSVVEGGLAQNCRVLARNPQGELQSICSGTVTGIREVTTAQHCILDDDTTYEVGCGQEMITDSKYIEITKKGSKVYTQAPVFKEIHLVTRSLPVLGEDIARLILEEDSQIPPVIELTANQSMDLLTQNHPLKMPASCSINGFGLHEGFSGVLHHDSTAEMIYKTQKGRLSLRGPNYSTPSLLFLDAEDLLDKDGDQVILDFTKEALANNQNVKPIVAAGDSGSGLLCQKDGQIYLLGVSHSITVIPNQGMPEIFIENDFSNPDGFM